jgi:hypothetical protein
MGLDMYLHASRRFDPESQEGGLILAHANLSLSQLAALTESDEGGMYLGRWDFYDPDEKRLAEAINDVAGLSDFTTPDSCSGYLSLEDGEVAVHVVAAYWRKANAIHSWFVENCQDGIDECQLTPVHPEQLAHLKATCETARDAYLAGDARKAAEIMTPRSGFFFGSTDVDEWYFEDLVNTVNEIDRLVNLAARTPGVVHFAYRSSW